MDELKEKIAAIVEAELEPYTHLACMAAGKAADRILSIPEIAEALALQGVTERILKRADELDRGMSKPV